MKKKKGAYLCEVSIGEDKEAISIVTHCGNIQGGLRVIVAPVDSTLNGKKLEASKIGGESSEGHICSPSDLGWPGDPNLCIVLDKKFAVGEFAPTDPTSVASLSKTAEDEEGDDDDGKKKGKKAKEEAPKAKAKGKSAAKKGKAKDEDDEEEEDADFGRKKGK